MRTEATPPRTLHPLSTAAGLAAAAFLVLMLVSCGEAGRHTGEIRLTGEALGTVWSVTLVPRAGIQTPSRAALRERIDVTLARVDRSLSNWRDDSELSRFNRGASGAPFRFSPEARRVVRAALTLARETGGAFDPTVGPLVRAWGFGPSAAKTEPMPEAVDRLRARVGWTHLAWDEEDRLHRAVPGVELDLSAIAKGYAVDALVEEIVRDRPRGLLVELGGEVRALGASSVLKPWRVGVENAATPGGELEAVLAMTAGALATSGDYRQFRIVAGERRSHVIDPRTGRPVDNRVASSSVVAPTCMEADGVATALMVLGPEEGLAWVEERPWLEALILLRKGDRIVARRASSGWERWLAE